MSRNFPICMYVYACMCVSISVYMCCGANAPSLAPNTATKTPFSLSLSLSLAHTSLQVMTCPDSDLRIRTVNGMCVLCYGLVVWFMRNFEQTILSLSYFFLLHSLHFWLDAGVFPLEPFLLKAIHSLRKRNGYRANSNEASSDPEPQLDSVQMKNESTVIAPIAWFLFSVCVCLCVCV